MSNFLQKHYCISSNSREVSPEKTNPVSLNKKVIRLTPKTLLQVLLHSQVQSSWLMHSFCQTQHSVLEWEREEVIEIRHKVAVDFSIIYANSQKYLVSVCMFIFFYSFYSSSLYWLIFGDHVHKCVNTGTRQNVNKKRWKWDNGMTCLLSMIKV